MLKINLHVLVHWMLLVVGVFVNSFSAWAPFPPPCIIRSLVCNLFELILSLTIFIRSTASSDLITSHECKNVLYINCNIQIFRKCIILNVPWCLGLAEPNSLIEVCSIFLTVRTKNKKKQLVPHCRGVKQSFDLVFSRVTKFKLLYFCCLAWEHVRVCMVGYFTEKL